MHPDLQSRFDDLEAKRKAMIARIKALPAEKQTARPGPKEFCAAELPMHMALAEQVDVDMMDKRPPSTFAGKRAKTGFMFRWAIKNMRAAKRMPTMGAMIPKDGTTLEDGERKWEDVRSKIRAYLEPLESPDAPALKHPFFRLMSAADLLDLLDAHQHYHDTRFPIV